MSSIKNTIATKLLLFGVVVILASSCLSSCTTILHSVGYQPIPSQKEKICQSSSVFMANLKGSQAQKKYLLTDGQLCQI